MKKFLLIISFLYLIKLTHGIYEIFSSTGLSDLLFLADSSFLLFKDTNTTSPNEGFLDQSQFNFTLNNQNQNDFPESISIRLQLNTTSFSIIYNSTLYAINPLTRLKSNVSIVINYIMIIFNRTKIYFYLKRNINFIVTIKPMYFLH